MDLLSEINREKLRPFLKEICSKYQRVPYHNFTHAFSLARIAYWIIRKKKKKKFFIKDDILAIIIACIAHDLNHPGMNNSYMVKSKNFMALIYNDASVLENMHTSLLFQILNNDKYNILDTLNRERYNYIRENIIESIIYTDMSKHDQLCSKLKELNEYNKQEKSMRIFLTSMLVHA